ncbi:hypothetical protein [Plebeiibacterium marinum]|uniref:CD-NTase associated protein 4-like DNA endonuclease domain-containing protein n=1 Tax=Plebeiibacterium marinum TaxID=2992111 RepID=A0AAE3MHN3_9BACT|nr:hypothetical protein [Plebeiobacterium marinum]MCW3808018.1 hypothetical protein [Plebeiobacterium marinum]
MTDSYYDTTSAADTFVGFEYQYYYFLFTLLDKLEDTGEIGFEVKDDVHIELPDGKLILVQLKHTTQIIEKGKSKGSLMYLATRDKDLWHTVHNWIEVIKNVGGRTSDEQVKYINNTIFQLVTNKQFSKDNSFLKELKKYKKDKSLAEFRKYLADLFAKTKDPDDPTKKNLIKGYIKEFQALNDDVLSSFLEHLFVETGIDELIEKIEKKIKYRKSIDEKQVEKAFNLLDSNLRKLIYKQIKDRKKVIIAAENFHKLSSRCLNIAKSGKLPERKGNFYKQPINLENQKFIKQLIDIKAINPENKHKIKELTSAKLSLMNLVKAWEQAGDLLSTDILELEETAIQKWYVRFETVERESEEINNKTIVISRENKLNKIALNCYDEVRKIELNIDNTNLTPKQSNGQYYYLSDENPKIGWRFDWEKKYKNEK